MQEGERELIISNHSSILPKKKKKNLSVIQLGRSIIKLWNANRLKTRRNIFLFPFLATKGNFWQAYINSLTLLSFFPLDVLPPKTCISFFNFQKARAKMTDIDRFQLRAPIVNEKWTSRVVIVTAPWDRVNGNYSRYEELSSHYGRFQPSVFLWNRFFFFCRLVQSTFPGTVTQMENLSDRTRKWPRAVYP